MGRYRRYLIGLAIAVVLLGAYGAAGFLAVPYYARRGLQDFVRQHYGRAVAMAEIRFNPFTLALDVSGFSLPDADGQPLLSFNRLHVGLRLASLWRLAPSFGEIILQQPYVRAVIRVDGALNLADLGKGFPSAPAKPQPKSEPMRLFIQRLAVISGTAAFEDQDRTRPFHAEFKPIAFELRDFSTTARTGNGYTLNAASPEGERLIWSGTLRLEPVSSHGVFEIADLQARTLWRYLRESLSFEMASGVIAIKGDYDLASAGGPLALKLNVHNILVTKLGLKPNGAAENCIDLGRIEIADTRLDMSRRSVEVAKVQVSGGDVKVWMSEPGRLNLLDLVAAPAAQRTAPAQADAATAAAAPAAATSPASTGASAPAWTVSVPDIAIAAVKVSAEDRQVKPAAALVLDPLNVHVAGFNTSPDDTLDLTLDSGVNSSGRIDAKARVTAKSGAVSAHVEAADLGLQALQPYIAQYTSMTLLRGTLSAKLDIERGADGSLAVKGKTRVAGLSTVDNALKQDFVKWKELLIADLSYRSKPAGLRIGTVTALEPYVRMIIAPDRTVNIKNILTPPGAASRTPPATDNLAPADTAASGRRAAAPVQTAAPAASAATPFPVSIATVRFIKGSADYSDLWIKPSFAVGIQTLEGTVSGLSSDPKSRAKVELNGKVDRYSPVHIGGQINVLSAQLYTDVTMSMKDLDLTIVNPYSGHFAGYKIDKGKLSVDVSYKVEQRQLAAQQHFVVDDLQLGDRVESPDAVHLPLKIAVALLKDRNGVIDINLPMNGSLDDPTFSIGPIIWKAFVNLIVKAATAPFALLGHLFGGGEHPNIVEFAAGSAELDPPVKEQLASLVKALKERPQLKLDVPIVFSPGLDRPQMAAARLRQELLARAQNTRQGKKHPDTAGEMALSDPQKHFQLLVDQYQADLGKEAQLPPSAAALQAAKAKETPAYEAAIADLNAALINHIEVPDADLEALGKQRAQAIQDALLSDGQVDAARVFIVNAPPKPDSGDKVKVELAVK
jgi:uncharacterized protein DUF748